MSHERNDSPRQKRTIQYRKMFLPQNDSKENEEKLLRTASPNRRPRKMVKILQSDVIGGRNGGGGEFCLVEEGHEKGEFMFHEFVNDYPTKPR